MIIATLGMWVAAVSEEQNRREAAPPSVPPSVPASRIPPRYTVYKV